MGEASNGKVPQSVKYAIIGAGIHGLSTAFHLAQMLKKTGRGSGEDILVVDKTAIAAGASGIACGVVRNNYFQPAMSNCDSELLAVYTANNLEQGATLEDSLKSSIKDIDGVFTYLVATASELGMAKDTMAAKPMVMFESDNLVALASEEVAIRAIVPREIDTSDPYDEEVRVWQR